MSTTAVRDGRRLARPLQAVYVAMRHAGGSHADTLAAFYRQLELEDHQAMAIDCLDPNTYQGWAWWAERMLEAAGEQPERPAPAAPPVTDNAVPGFLVGLTVGVAYGVLLATWWR